MAEADTSSGGKRVVMLLLAIAEIFAALLAAFFAAMSVMMFDAPGSDQRTDLCVAFWSTCAVPVALIVGAGFAAAGAWRYTRRRLVIALAVPGVAILWLAICLASLGSS